MRPEHRVEETGLNRYCFYGQYVDGGLYDTHEEARAETCSDVSVYEPGPNEIRDVCKYYHDAPVQGLFDEGAEFVAIDVHGGTLKGSSFGLHKAGLAGICEGEAPADATVLEYVIRNLPALDLPITPIPLEVPEAPQDPDLYGRVIACG
jgi:hypothetical protein